MTEIFIRTAGPEDHALLGGLLRGLSADSAYLRFQTGIGSQPSPALVRALLASDRALLGFVGDEVVAHGMWARVGKAAEIAIVVADAHQGHGIGTALAQVLVDEVAARGVRRIEVFSGRGNEAVARMVARQAPNALRVLDGPTVTWTFAVPQEETSTARSRSAYSRCSHSSVRIAPSARLTR
jgi:GNAT superfamily N-acetyltransferase